jgi:hypothetical protein
VGEGWTGGVTTTSALHVPFQARRFPPALSVPASGLLALTWSDLAQALFVTGRAPGDEATYPRLALYEWLHRVAIIPAYLSASKGRVLRTPLADSLDRSEKVNLSYAFGQAGTALFCCQRLGVSRLLHVDRYTSSHRLAFGLSRRRPDLFGSSPLGWVVAEAKGRSNNVDAQLPVTLQAQKGALRTVGGTAPAVALGCITFFETRLREMQVLAVDPPVGKESVDLDADPERFLYAYYDAFAAAIGPGQPSVRDGADYVMAPDLPGTLALGLRRSIFGAVVEARRSGERRLAADREDLAGVMRDGPHGDGTVVELLLENSFDLSGRDEGDRR